MEQKTQTGALRRTEKEDLRYFRAFGLGGFLNTFSSFLLFLYLSLFLHWSDVNMQRYRKWDSVLFIWSSMFCNVSSMWWGQCPYLIILESEKCRRSDGKTLFSTRRQDNDDKTCNIISNMIREMRPPSIATTKGHGDTGFVRKCTRIYRKWSSRDLGQHEWEGGIMQLPDLNYQTRYDTVFVRRTNVTIWWLSKRGLRGGKRQGVWWMALFSCASTMNDLNA